MIIGYPPGWRIYAYSHRRDPVVLVHFDLRTGGLSYGYDFHDKVAPQTVYGTDRPQVDWSGDKP